MEHEGAFVGRGRALEGAAGDEVDDLAAFEFLEDALEADRAGEGVVGFGGFGEAGDGGHVGVGAEGDDEIVGLEVAVVGFYSSRRCVDVRYFGGEDFDVLAGEQGEGVDAFF